MVITDSAFKAIYGWHSGKPEFGALRLALTETAEDAKTQALLRKLQELTDSYEIMAPWLGEGKRKRRDKLIEDHLGREATTALLTDVERVNQVFNVAQAKPEPKQEKPRTLDKLKPSSRAELFLKESQGRFAVHPQSEEIYQYDNGVWVRQNKPLMLRRVMAMFDRYATSFKDNDADEVLKVVRNRLPYMSEPSPFHIAFANGVVNLKDLGFLPHHPEWWLVFWSS